LKLRCCGVDWGKEVLKCLHCNCRLREPTKRQTEEESYWKRVENDV